MWLLTHDSDSAVKGFYQLKTGCRGLISYFSVISFTFIEGSESVLPDLTKVLLT